MAHLSRKYPPIKVLGRVVFWPLCFSISVLMICQETDTHMLKIHDKFLNILLYADDMVLMAHSQIDLRDCYKNLTTIALTIF